MQKEKQKYKKPSSEWFSTTNAILAYSSFSVLHLL